MSDDSVLFSKVARGAARSLIGKCKGENLLLVTAEYCTGGLVSSCISAVPGAATVFDYGFIVLTEKAQKTLLGVPEMVLFRQGAVSGPVARAMAEGAAQHGAEYGIPSRRTLALAITGQISGQAGQAIHHGRAHMALALRAQNSSAEIRHNEQQFEADHPEKLRLAMVEAILTFAVTTLEELAPRGMGLAT